MLTVHFSFFPIPVREARIFHQGGQANDVFGALTDDFMQDVVSAVDKLLNRNFPVTVYSGQVDLICTVPMDVVFQSLGFIRSLHMMKLFEPS